MGSSLRRTGILNALIALLSLSSVGCVTTTHSGQGAVLGGGFGALTGATLAGRNPIEGALVGGLVGATAGSILGDAEDAREERDAAMQYAAQVEASSATALTNPDILKMSANGVGDQVIIQSIQSRGGRFDVSPDALVHLKASGVSDRVLEAMQRSPSLGVMHPTNFPQRPNPGSVWSPIFPQPRPSVEFGFFVGGPT